MNDNEVKTMIEEMHKAIVGGLDGSPGLIERVRILECFRDRIITGTKVTIGFVGANLFALIALFFKVN